MLAEEKYNVIYYIGNDKAKAGKIIVADYATSLINDTGNKYIANLKNSTDIKIFKDGLKQIIALRCEGKNIFINAKSNTKYLANLLRHI